MKKPLEQFQPNLNTSTIVYPTLKHRKVVFRDEQTARERLLNSPLQKRLGLESNANPFCR